MCLPDGLSWAHCDELVMRRHVTWSKDGWRYVLSGTHILINFANYNIWLDLSWLLFLFANFERQFQNIFSCSSRLMDRIDAENFAFVWLLTLSRVFPSLFLTSIQMCEIETVTFVSFGNLLNCERCVGIDHNNGELTHVRVSPVFAYFQNIFYFNFSRRSPSQLISTTSILSYVSIFLGHIISWNTAS